MDIALRFLIFSTVYFLVTEAEETAPQPTDNHISKKCAKCPPGWGTVKRCTKTADTQCARCAHGTTYSSYSSSKSPCWPCSKCGVGLFESHKCTPARDTICSECISYFDHKSIIKNNDFLKRCKYLFLKPREVP